MLALRLWPFLPPELASELPMLPKGCPAPGPGTFMGSQDVQSARAAGLAFTTPTHLSSIGEALAEASASHPPVHSEWLALLSLLIPGFTPVKVLSSSRPLACGLPTDCCGSSTPAAALTACKTYIFSEDCHLDGPSVSTAASISTDGHVRQRLMQAV